MGQLEDILKHQKAVMNNIAKSFVENSEDNLEKARSGIYADNAENRRLNRVGQRYGSSKQDEQNNTQKKKIKRIKVLTTMLKPLLLKI